MPRMLALALLFCVLTCMVPVGAAAAQTVIAQSNITLYSEPSADSAPAGTVEAGTQLIMTAVEGTWCQVQTDTVSGWCSSGLVRAKPIRYGSRVNVPSSSDSQPTATQVPNTSQTPVPTAVPSVGEGVPVGDSTVPLPEGYGVSTATRLNVREAPGTSSRVLAQLNYGTRMRLVQHQDGWYQIQLGSGFGWVKSDFVSTRTATQQAAAVPYEPKTGESDYLIWINLDTQVGAVLSKDDAGRYSVVVRTFGLSTGLYDRTPTGLFTTYEAYRWKYMHEDCYTQYAMRIYKGIMLHSEPYYTADPSTMMTGGYNKLGSPASEGCIRMRAVDIKWIYENCGLGTLVDITAGGSLPGVPSSITYEQLPYSVTWDPTDPDPDNPYYGKYNETYVVW